MAIAELERKFEGFTPHHQKATGVNPWMNGTRIPKGNAPKPRLLSRGAGFTLITQNVDGLHDLAGSKNILELHGNIWRVRCTACSKVEVNRDVPIKILPMCRCGGLLRPDVVWFGEMLPVDVLNRAFHVADTCNFMLVVGTSGVVQPAASLALRAKGEGAFIVEVNLEETPLSVSVDATLLGKAGEILPLLI
ncbi:MAG: hypothetical protein HY878_05625 [Deltaproteobacteria bacterium]|nr:hypothetical protein [Deltaproteobacteria bacterium]